MPVKPIETLQNHKEALEQEILDACNQFTEETGCYVEKVDVQWNDQGRVYTVVKTKIAA